MFLVENKMVEEPTEEQPVEEIEEVAEEPEEKEIIEEPEVAEIEEEPCDPTIMSCDQMRDRIMGLSKERYRYNKTIEKLEEVKEIFPSEEIETIHKNAMDKRNKVDDEIFKTFEKFTICTRPTIITKEETAEEE